MTDRNSRFRWFDNELIDRLGQDVFVQVDFIEPAFSEREPTKSTLGGFNVVWAVPSGHDIDKKRA